MKKYLGIILVIILATCLVACGSSGKHANSEQENKEKIAVAYFSGTGNTR